MQPLLFIDKETTGLDAATAAPVEISALVLAGPHDGKSFTGKMRPFDGADINPYALTANGLTLEEIRTWPQPADVFGQFNDWLETVLPERTLAKPAGYNFAFDDRFLRAWYARHGEVQQYSFQFDGTPVEVMDVIKQTWPANVGTVFPKKGGMKLTFQHEFHFGTVHDKAHTALADCIATRSLFLHCDRVSGRGHYQDYYHYIPELPAKTLS